MSDFVISKNDDGVNLYVTLLICIVVSFVFHCVQSAYCSNLEEKVRRRNNSSDGMVDNDEEAHRMLFDHDSFSDCIPIEFSDDERGEQGQATRSQSSPCTAL